MLKKEIHYVGDDFSYERKRGKINFLLLNSKMKKQEIYSFMRIFWKNFAFIVCIFLYFLMKNFLYKYHKIFHSKNHSIVLVCSDSHTQFFYHDENIYTFSFFFRRLPQQQNSLFLPLLLPTTLTHSDFSFFFPVLCMSQANIYNNFYFIFSFFWINNRKYMRVKAEAVAERKTLALLVDTRWWNKKE